MSRFFSNLAASLLRRMDDTQLARVVVSALAERSADLPPAAALALLFRIDEQLYHLQGQQAVRHGNGVHSKHRHTNYHQFFTAALITKDQVLDIGCGNGVLSNAMAQLEGVTVVGVDISATSLAQARQERPHPRVSYLEADITTTIPGGEFSVITLSNVLEHLPNRPQLLTRLIASCHPRLMVIRVPLSERDWRVPLKRELGVEWRLDRTHQVEYTPEEFINEMAAAGLTIRSQELHWGEIWATLEPQPAATATTPTTAP